MEKIAKEQKEQFDELVEVLGVDEDDVSYIIDLGYDLDTLYHKIVRNGDYMIYNFSSYNELGEELYEVYVADCYNIPKVIEDYFDFEAYAKDFLLETENIQLEDKLLVIY